MLKWIGNKQRSAAAIAAYLPNEYERYFEPFVGGAAVLATLSPAHAVAADTLGPLIELWSQIRDEPATVLAHYTREWWRYTADRQGVYDEVLARYNADPNGLDLLFLCRTCYGGVVRFTKKGEMSTPLGAHRAIPPEALASRLAVWRPRIVGTEFVHQSFELTMADAGDGDIVYCDPPYSFSQPILYGSQGFSIEGLWAAVSQAKRRGAKIAVSIDGSARSGEVVREHRWPEDLFAREVFLHLGGSMLKRFQLDGADTEAHRVSDRLLLSW
jgi:DNA adenine methylase